MGYFGTHDPNIQDNVYKQAEMYVKTHDAFQDNPWPIIYHEMDEKYPGSKFILTLRPTDQWINSAVNHFQSTVRPMHNWIYGVGFPKGNESIWIERFERHNQEVQEYFKNRPDDLLVINLFEGDGWREICPFLGKKTLRSKFPHSNKRSNIGKNYKDKTLFYRAYYKFRRKVGGLDL
jgi:hypothetical protein